MSFCCSECNNNMMGFPSGERSNNVGDSTDFEVSQQVGHLLLLFRSSLRLSDHPAPPNSPYRHTHTQTHAQSLSFSALWSAHAPPLSTPLSCVPLNFSVLFCFVKSTLAFSVVSAGLSGFVMIQACQILVAENTFGMGDGYNLCEK